MSDIRDVYSIPPELMDFVDQGLLEMLSETPAERSVTFHIPPLAHNDSEDRLTSYVLKWIHPDFNAQFCDYYNETPGDLPNFLLIEEREGQADRRHDFASLDELTAWLDDLPVVHT